MSCVPSGISRARIRWAGVPLHDQMYTGLDGRHDVGTPTSMHRRPTLWMKNVASPGDGGRAAACATEATLASAADARHDTRARSGSGATAIRLIAEVQLPRGGYTGSRRFKRT